MSCEARSPTVRSALAAAALSFAALASGCAGGGPFGEDGDDDDLVEVDLLVIPPLGSSVPAQIVSGLDAAQLGDGRHDLTLSRGVDVTVHVRSTSMLPIDGAAVRFRMRGATGYDVVEVTGTSGDVNLPLGAGTYDVEIDPNGDLYPDLPPHVFRDFVVTGPLPKSEVLVLEAGYLIRGTLRDAAGGLLQLWQVSARREGMADERSSATTTSAFGAFQIRVPTAGTWVLQLSPPPLAQGQPTANVRLDVEADIADFQFQFPPIETHTLSGTVTGLGDLATDYEGITVRARAPALLVDAPFEGVTISFSGSTTTNEGGFFSLPVLHGTYTVSIEPAPNFEYSHAVTALEITQDVTLAETVTELFPKVTVSGVAGQALTSEGTRAARVRLLSADGQTSYQFADPDGTNDDGEFSIIANVGSYTAEVLPAPGSGLVRTRLPVTVASSITDLAIGLSAGQRVQGRVRDADGDALSLVTIIALDPDTALPVGSDEAVSDQSGDYAITVPYLSAPALP